MADEYNATRKHRTDRCPWFVDRFFQLNHTDISSIVTQGSVVSTLRPAATRSESTSRQARRDPSPEPAETENPNQNDNEAVLHDPLRDLPEWLQEFTHREPCGRKSSSTQGRSRELFSWVSFRAAEERGIG